MKQENQQRYKTFPLFSDTTRDLKWVQNSKGKTQNRVVRRKKKTLVRKTDYNSSGSSLLIRKRDTNYMAVGSRIQASSSSPGSTAAVERERKTRSGHSTLVYFAPGLASSVANEEIAHLHAYAI